MGRVNVITIERLSQPLADSDQQDQQATQAGQGTYEHSGRVACKLPSEPLVFYFSQNLLMTSSGLICIGQKRVHGLVLLLLILADYFLPKAGVG